MKIVGDTTIVEIDILRKGHPGSKNTWDEQWLVTCIKVRLDGFQACFEAHMMKDELKSFIDSLSSALDTHKE